MADIAVLWGSAILVVGALAVGPGLLALSLHCRVVGDGVVMIPARSEHAAARWQDLFDGVVVAAAVSAVAGVALQALADSGPVRLLGALLVAVSWLAFLVDVLVMLAVSPQPARWARGHALELVLVVTTFPLWPLLAGQLLLLELLPALTVLETTKLAKLAKVARAVGRGGPGAGRPLAAVILSAAAGTALLLVLG